MDAGLQLALLGAEALARGVLGREIALQLPAGVGGAPQVGFERAQALAEIGPLGVGSGDGSASGLEIRLLGGDRIGALGQRRGLPRDLVAHAGQIGGDGIAFALQLGDAGASAVGGRGQFAAVGGQRLARLLQLGGARRQGGLELVLRAAQRFQLGAGRLQCGMGRLGRVERRAQLAAIVLARRQGAGGLLQRRLGAAALLVRRKQLLAQAGDDRVRFGPRRLGGRQRRLQLAQLGGTRRQLRDLRVEGRGLLAAGARGVERLLQLRLERGAFGLQRRQRGILGGGALLGLGHDGAELRHLGLRRVGGLGRGRQAAAQVVDLLLDRRDLLLRGAQRGDLLLEQRGAFLRGLEERLGGDSLGGLQGALALRLLEGLR